MNQRTTAPGVLVRVRRDGDLAEAAEGLGVVHVTDGYPVEGVADPVGWLSPAGMVGAWAAEAGGGSWGMWPSRGKRLVLDVLAKDTAAIRPHRRLGWTEPDPVVHEFASGAVDALCFVSPAAP